MGNRPRAVPEIPLPVRLEPGFFGARPAWFLERVSGVPVDAERDEVVARLHPVRLEQLRATGLPGRKLVLAEQVHGAGLAVVRAEEALPSEPIPGVDGLLTDRKDVWLGILVADCAAVYLFDWEGDAIGLLHSGRKGTEAGILPRAVEAMQMEWGIPADRLGVWISPCIRPPHYEVDFAEELRCQARGAGVGVVRDEGICTASNPERFYSYRRELGKTGRMLAVFGAGVSGDCVG